MEGRYPPTSWLGGLQTPDNVTNLKIAPEDEVDSLHIFTTRQHD